MNKELKLEAEEYIKSSKFESPTGHGMKEVKQAFIDGIKSKYVEKQKLEFAIEQISEMDKKCFGGSNTCKAKIKELEEKLEEL
jgi:hypothetical protein